jgi:epimerase transport system membrane fusion protein
LSTHTVGGVIKPGEPLLDIVPELAELVVDARVSPIDIDRVSLGMEATVRFSAFKSATTPTISAEVTKISADRLVDEKTGIPYFLARVEVTEEGRNMLGSLMLVPGMPAEVLIKTGERTLFEYLVQPARNAFARSLIED